MHRNDQKEAQQSSASRANEEESQQHKISAEQEWSGGGQVSWRGEAISDKIRVTDVFPLIPHKALKLSQKLSNGNTQYNITPLRLAMKGRPHHV